MEDSQQTPKVTLAYIEGILQQSSQRDHRWLQQRLRDLQRVVRQRQKELRIFFMTVDALQTQYKRRHHSQYQLLDRLTEDIQEYERLSNYHQRQQNQDHHQLQLLEKQLIDLRTYATQRRDKKAKREKQYHNVYHLPLVNKQYKKKYMRARDKNNAVEQQLSDLHHDMDVVKEHLKQYRQQQSSDLERGQQVAEQHRQLGSKLDHEQTLMSKMKQAQSFWCQFDTHHIQRYLDLLSQQRADWTQLRLATADYEDAERLGRQTWQHSTWDVTFECTHCHDNVEEWPCLDKVRTTKLMCTACFQETRTSMIVEKKLHAILPNQKVGDQVPPALLRLSTLSTLSTSSSTSIPSLISTTSKSTHSVLSECKPFIKKMRSVLTLNHKMETLGHQSLSQRTVLA